MALYLFLLDLFLEMLVLRSENFFRYFGKLKDTVISFWNFLTFKIICTYKYFLSLIYRWSIWDLFSILELIWEIFGISWTLLWSAVLSSLFIILWRKFFFLLTTGFWGKEVWDPTPKWNTRFFFAFFKRTQLWLP